MIIFPALHLKNGQCVRLSQGNFAETTIYESDPVRQAVRFAEAGASWLHVVDLDGARGGELRQLDLISQIAKETHLSLQVGGGIRTEAHIDALLQAGAARVLIGSLAVQNPNLVGAWLEIFGPEKIALALDVRLSASGLPEVLTHGWQKGSALTLWSVMEAYKNTGLRTLLCTDVGRDGTLEGSNHQLYSQMRQIWSTAEILASGGINSLEDLQKLKALGLSGALVGKALYEGQIDLAAAIRAAM